VTGSRRGIGLAIAGSLAADGYDVVLNGTGGSEEIGDRIRALEDLGAAVHYCRADISQVSDRERLLAECLSRFGRISLLVNNAGVAPSVRADILDTSEESYDRVMAINLKGPYFLTQAVARHMLSERERDREARHAIVNVSSISARVASVNRGEYCISKAGVSMATKLWAVRLAAHGIPVYEVQPGITRTDMTAGVTAKYDALIEQGLVPQGRWGLPEDVGRAVAMLARGDLGFSTGAVILVDGGQLLERL
jgi:NAD(P)-dependent dehydrogenase (short-subunit alcohol dehydrogenase family)